MVRRLLGVAGVAVVILVWTIFTWGSTPESRIISPVLLPSPLEVIGTSREVLDVHDRYVETAQTLGASQRQVITKVLIALAFPDIFSSLRNLFGLAFGYIMLAELINAKYGLGYLLMTSQRRA